MPEPEEPPQENFPVADCGAQSHGQAPGQVETATQESPVNSATEREDAVLAPAPPLPKMIAGYQIRREIGRGGMGIVYEAEQQNPRRLVALKIILGGQYVDDARVRLFQREVQTLARLKHPNIAAIYEAGRTDDGRHFFVMEMVPGVALSEYVSGPGSAQQGRVLGLQDRLELFCELCEAINYAHQRGVIHRDLKPSNILIDREGRPKVLDFGLARITDQDAEITTIVTEPGRLVGTLPYMSPEQARGNPEEIDVRTDVYSLGVILYELVTGQLPLVVTRTRADQAVRIICEENPRKPSTINRSLRGDLETIVLKALEKEPPRRYQSADALADDVKRYLSGQPILARPPSAAYQLHRLIARHKVTFGLTALLLASLVAFAITMAVQRAHVARQRDRAVEAEQLAASRLEETQAALSKAEQETQKAQQILAFLNEMLSSVDPQYAQGREVGLLREVLDRAAGRAESELANQPEVRAAIDETIGLTYQGLALYDKAQWHLVSVLETRRALLGVDHPDTMDAALNLAALRVRQGRYEQAEGLCRGVLERSRRKLGDDDPYTLGATAELALVLKHRGALAEAESLYRTVLEAYHLTPDEQRPEVLRVCNNLAAVLQEQGKFEEVEPLLRQVLASYRSLRGEEHPDTLTAMSNLGWFLQGRGHLDEAEALYRRALEVHQRVHGPEHPATLTTSSNLAGLLHARGHLEQAEELHRHVLETQLRRQGEEHPDTLRDMNNLAYLLGDRGQLDEAQSLYRRTLEIQQRTLGPEHPNTLASMNNLAVSLKRGGDVAGAAELYRQVLDTMRRVVGEEHPNTLGAANNLAGVLRLQGQPAEAESLYRESIAVLRRVIGEEHPTTLTLMNNLASCLREQDKLEEAETWYRRVVEGAQTALPPGHHHTALFQVFYGSCLRKLERYAEAEEELLAGFTVLRDVLGPEDERTLDAAERLALLYEAWGRLDQAAPYRAMVPARAQSQPATTP